MGISDCRFALDLDLEMSFGLLELSSCDQWNSGITKMGLITTTISLMILFKAIVFIKTSI